MRAHLERFSSFHNRYYLSKTGVESAEWLYGQISAVLDVAGHPTANVRYVRHTAWSQPSIIVTIPGRNQRTVVLGGHLDSVISGDRGAGRAPGAGEFQTFDVNASRSMAEKRLIMPLYQMTTAPDP